MNVKLSVTRSPEGFALVGVVTLLVLLSLLSVGLLSLSSLVLRTGQSTAAQMEARANARVALQLAIGQLQRTVGADQRVTASARFAEQGYLEQWTGVWRTGELAKRWMVISSQQWGMAQTGARHAHSRTEERSWLLGGRTGSWSLWSLK